MFGNWSRGKNFIPPKKRVGGVNETPPTSLRVNVKIEKSILKYFIAEDNSNVTILDGNISWCRYLFGDQEAPLQNG